MFEVLIFEKIHYTKILSNQSYFWWIFGITEGQYKINVINANKNAAKMSDKCVICPFNPDFMNCLLYTLQA